MADIVIDVILPAPPPAVDVLSLGVQGPPGEPGPPGPAGPAGPPGTAGLHAATHHTGGADAITGALGLTTLTASGFVAVGANPSPDGAIRIGNMAEIRSSAVGPIGSVRIAQVDNGDNLQIGTGANAIGLAATTYVNGAIIGPSSVAIGATPAQSGAVRLGNMQAIYGRNAANTADQHLIRANSDDSVNIGQSGQLLISEASGFISKGDAYAEGGTIPTANNTYDVGRADLKWRNGLFATSVQIGATPAQSGAVRLGNNQAIMMRNGDNSADTQAVQLSPSNQLAIGTDAAHINLVPHVNAHAGIDIGGSAPLAVYNGGWFQMFERAAMGNAPGNAANLWVEDNGAGKSRLMIRFATGAAVQIAIEP